MVTTGLRQEGRRPGHNPSEADGVLPVGCVFSAFTLLWLDLEFFPHGLCETGSQRSACKSSKDSKWAHHLGILDFYFLKIWQVVLLLDGKLFQVYSMFYSV